MVRPVTRVIAYCRVSTEEQGLGDSLDAQQARLRAHCIAHSLELVRVESDSASASTLTREGLGRALATIEQGGASGLVVVKLDRLTRSVRDLVALRDQGMGDEWRLISLAEQVDTSTPTGRMFMTLIVTLAEWERETTAARTKDLLAYARSQGQHLGAVPYGWKRVKVQRDANGRRVGERGRLERDTEQQRVLVWMHELKAADLSLEGIASQLNGAAITASRGGRWTKMGVWRALKAQGVNADSSCPGSSISIV